MRQYHRTMVDLAENKKQSRARYLELSDLRNQTLLCRPRYLPETVQLYNIELDVISRQLLGRQ